MFQSVAAACNSRAVFITLMILQAYFSLWHFQHDNLPELAGPNLLLLSRVPRCSTRHVHLWPSAYVIACKRSTLPPTTTTSSAAALTITAHTHIETHTPSAQLSLGKWICLMMERVHYLAVQWSACGPSRLAVSSPQNRSGSLLGPARRMGWSCSLIHHSSAGNKQSWGGFKKKEEKEEKKGNQCKRHNSSRRTWAIPSVAAVAAVTVRVLMT